VHSLKKNIKDRDYKASRPRLYDQDFQNTASLDISRVDHDTSLDKSKPGVDMSTLLPLLPFIMIIIKLKKNNSNNNNN